LLDFLNLSQWNNFIVFQVVLFNHWGINFWDKILCFLRNHFTNKPETVKFDIFLEQVVYWRRLLGRWIRDIIRERNGLLETRIGHYGKYIAQIDKFCRRALRYGYTSKYTLMTSYIVLRDRQLWNNIIIDYPLYDLLPPQRSRFLSRGHAWFYFVTCKNREV